MPTEFNPLTAPSSLEGKVSERLDWKLPLLGVTGAFVFIGVSSVLRHLPIRTLFADLLTMPFVLGSLYGLHRARIISLDTDGSRGQFSRVSQGFLNFAGTFVFLVSVYSWMLGGQTAHNVTVAAVTSFFIVFTKYRPKTSRSHSAHT